MTSWAAQSIRDHEMTAQRLTERTAAAERSGLLSPEASEELASLSRRAVEGIAAARRELGRIRPIESPPPPDHRADHEVATGATSSGSASPG